MEKENRKEGERRKCPTCPGSDLPRPLYSLLNFLGLKIQWEIEALPDSHQVPVQLGPAGHEWRCKGTTCLPATLPFPSLLGAAKPSSSPPWPSFPLLTTCIRLHLEPTLSASTAQVVTPRVLTGAACPRLLPLGSGFFLVSQTEPTPHFPIETCSVQQASSAVLYPSPSGEKLGFVVDLGL